MNRNGEQVLPRGQVWVSASEAQAMGFCTVTGDHETCSPFGCVCGCHKLNPWPWETGDES